MKNTPETVTELRWIRMLLILIALPVVVIILKALKTIFIPLIFAAFLSFLFAPMRAWLKKKKVPGWLTLTLMVIVLLLMISVFGGVVYAAVNSFIVQLPKYQERFTELIQNAITWGEAAFAQMDLALANIPNVDAASLVSGSGISVTKFLSGTFGTFMSATGTLFLTLIFMLFLVSGSGKLEKRLSKVLTPEDTKRTMQTMTSIQEQIQKYFGNKFLISISTATVAMLILWIFGIDFVIVAGIIYVVMNFIPSVGSIISVSFALLLCLLQYGFDFRLVLLFVLLEANELFFSNVIEPRVMGERMNLSPIMILISLIFWGYVWGVIGMMIAVPMTSAINIIIKKMNDKSIISAVISDN